MIKVLIIVLVLLPSIVFSYDYVRRDRFGNLIETGRTIAPGTTQIRDSTNTINRTIYPNNITRDRFGNILWEDRGGR